MGGPGDATLLGVASARAIYRRCQNLFLGHFGDKSAASESCLLSGSVLKQDGFTCSITILSICSFIPITHG